MKEASYLVGINAALAGLSIYKSVTSESVALQILFMLPAALAFAVLHHEIVTKKES